MSSGTDRSGLLDGCLAAYGKASTGLTNRSLRAVVIGQVAARPGCEQAGPIGRVSSSFAEPRLGERIHDAIDGVGGAIAHDNDTDPAIGVEAHDVEVPATSAVVLDEARVSVSVPRSTEPR